jgi:hypothetical protein
MELEFMQILMTKHSVIYGESYKISKALALEHLYHKEVEVVVNVHLLMVSHILIFGAKSNHWIKAQAVQLQQQLFAHMLLWLPTHIHPNIVNYGVKFKNWPVEVCANPFVHMHLESTLLHMMILFVTYGINFKILKEMALEPQYLQGKEVGMFVCLYMLIPIKVYGAELNLLIKVLEVEQQLSFVHMKL